MNKHAYLIIAHNQFELLEKLIRLIDDKRNDIYIHIDKKVKDFDIEYFKNIPNHSNIYFTERTDVRWGDYSQINSEYLLLKKAKESKTKYSYFHILSGVDLPLKSQDYIHDFFDKIKDKEVVQLTTDNFIKKCNAYYRISRYHFFSKHFKSNNFFIKHFINLFTKVFMPLQRILKVNRLNDKLLIGYGANWVSITNNFVDYIISKEGWVKKTFKYSRCADELFIQTLLVNSSFKNNLYSKKIDEDFNGHSHMRYIDWKRGNPYTYTKEDYKELINSNMLFARKFNIEKDREVIDLIYKTIKGSR